MAQNGSSTVRGRKRISSLIENIGDASGVPRPPKRQKVAGDDVTSAQDGEPGAAQSRTGDRKSLGRPNKQAARQRFQERARENGRWGKQRRRMLKQLDLCIGDNKNQSGHESSLDANRQLLVLIANLLKERLAESNISHNMDTHVRAAITRASEYTMRSNQFLTSLWKEYWDQGRVLQPTRKSTTAYKGAIEPHHIAEVQSFILTQQIEGVRTTSHHIVEHLKEKFNAQFSRRQVKYMLRKCPQFKYGALKQRARYKPKEQTQERIRQYLCELSKALNKPNVELVYVDESFVNTRHHKRHGYYIPDSVHANNLYTGTGKGKRLIIVHAITRHGLLCKLEADGSNVRVAADAKGPQLTTEMLYEAGVQRGDYHKNFDSEMFKRWITERLFPTFEHLFPNKQLVLVLDNAPYHHARGPDFLTPATMSKHKLLDALVARHVTHINVIRETTVVKIRSDDWLQRAPRGAYQNELQAALEAYLRLQPQQSEIQKLFKEKGYELIYTPPYTPCLQPIELVWARVKGYVAERFDTHRNVHHLRLLVVEAFQQTITPQFCNSVVDHCLNECNKFIKLDPDVLVGNIYQLGVKDLVCVRLDPPGADGVIEELELTSESEGDDSDDD